MTTSLANDIRNTIRVCYALRRVPDLSSACLLPCPNSPEPGDIALVRVEKIGKNAALELTNGRRCTLHEGDVLAVVFANRYATLQFEGYARAKGEFCDLLSMGGLCGLVESKHADVAEPTKLRLLGELGNAAGAPLRLGDFAIPLSPVQGKARTIVVCGTSMDAGKTYTATSLVVGLRQKGYRVAGIKLTGSAAGRDTWGMLDAGACVALDFIDGGLPSTYLCSLEKLLDLYRLLLAHAVSQKAAWVVVEIADGLLQNETAALLQSPCFTETVNGWMFAATDPLSAAAGVRILDGWGIKPLAISGLVTMSPLSIQEAQGATGLPCLTARQLQLGQWNIPSMKSVNGSFRGAENTEQRVAIRG